MSSSSTPNNVERHLTKLSPKDGMVMRRSVPMYLVVISINLYLQYYRPEILLEHTALHWGLELTGCYLTLLLFKGVMKMLGVVRGDVGLANPLLWRFTPDYGIKKGAASETKQLEQKQVKEADKRE